ncbi:hypothetical protein, partial [Streptomyces altiplanensis]
MSANVREPARDFRTGRAVHLRHASTAPAGGRPGVRLPAALGALGILDVLGPQPGTAASDPAQAAVCRTAGTAGAPAAAPASTRRTEP